MDEINFFAQTNARGQRQKFGIKLDDRRRHMYVIGKTGMGKTQMLQNMAIQDVIAGRGVGIIDPHGEFAEAVLDFVPKSRVNDVVYFNPADTEMPIGFNIMETVGAEQRYFVAAGLMAAFKKIWVDVWSARMEYILNNALLALLEYPNSTIMGANRMLADKDFRKKVVDNVKDPAVKSYWINEFAKYPERYREEATGAIQNKIGQFISNPLIRNIIGQTKSTFNLREIMDNKKILIVNLSKGRIGEDNTALLGTMLITKLQIATMSRVDIPEEERNDFFMYIDEFQTFATPSFAGILSEARKYRLALVLAHQYIAQMDELVRDAVFGNAGTLVSFRVGAADAEFMENEYLPAFMQSDLVNLGKYNIAIKLMIDGIASNAFSALTLPPFVQPEESHRDKVIKVSSERYGKDRSVIEEKIMKWSIASQEQGGESARGSAPVENKSFQKEQPEREMFDAVCSECGRSIKLPFKPDPNRPVYCKECFEKRKVKAAERPQSSSARPVELSSTATAAPNRDEPSPDNSGREKPRSDQAELGQSRAKLDDRTQPDQGSASTAARQAKLAEISLNNLPARSDRSRAQLDRSQSEAHPQRRNDFPVRPASAKSNLAASVATPRKEVDLESLRSTLGDITPQSSLARSQSSLTRAKSKNRGIMKEGEEINF